MIDRLIHLFNIADHFCFPNIIAYSVTVYPKHGSGEAANSIFAYLCCHTYLIWTQTAQFVFLSLQLRAANLALYNSCSQCASPPAPLAATRLINHTVTEERLLQCTSDRLSVTMPQIWTLSTWHLPPPCDSV